MKAGRQYVLVSYLRRHGGRFDPFSKKNLLRQLKRNYSIVFENERENRKNVIFYGQNLPTMVMFWPEKYPLKSAHDIPQSTGVSSPGADLILPLSGAAPQILCISPEIQYNLPS